MLISFEWQKRPSDVTLPICIPEISASYLPSVIEDQSVRFILLLLRWNYSPVRTFLSLMDFTQSALFFDLFCQLVILHLLISVCTQFHHLCLGRPVSLLTWVLLFNTWLTLLLLSILLTWPIKSNPHILTKQSTPKSPNSCSNSLLYRFLQFPFTLIPPSTLLKTLLSKAASLLATSLFSPHHYAPYVADGLIHVLQISIFSALSTDWPFSRARSA